MRLTTTSDVQGFFEKAGFWVIGPTLPGLIEGAARVEIWLEMDAVD